MNKSTGSKNSIDIGRIVLFDHHAHSLRSDFNQLDVLGFRQAFSESNSMTMLQDHVANSVYYMHMLRELGKCLDIEGEQRIIELRSQMRGSDYCEILFDDASIGAVIVDDGFNSKGMIELNQLAAAISRPVFRCLRLESIFEDVRLRSNSFNDFLNQVSELITELHSPRLVGLKTIAAYRGGLRIDAVSKAEAVSDFEQAKHSTNNFRIARRPFYHYALQECFELAGNLGLPVQIHSGIGDSDADLAESNPNRFRSILENPRFRKTNFVFLHCYPYVKEAAFLASLYANVYFDLSLACTLVSANMESMFLDAIAGAPVSKILAATDGHSIPETHWYAARSLRNGLSRALSSIVDDDFLTVEQASRAASAIFYENTKRLYRLDD